MEFQSGAVRPVGSIEEGWNIIKDDYWTFFLMTTVAVVVVVAAAVFFGFIDNLIVFGVTAAVGGAANSGDAQPVSAMLLPQTISLIISTFTNVIVIAISGALFCGIYASLSRKVSGGKADFSELFTGFQKIKQCFIVAVVLALVQLIIGIISLFSGAAVGVSALGAGIFTKDGNLNPAIFGGLFLVIMIFLAATVVINLFISVLTSFVYPLIAERNLSGGEALMLSAKSGLANLGGLILLLILLGLIMLVGFVVCCVGVLFVVPIISAALFAAYQSVFGRMESSFQHTPPPPPTFGNQPGF